MSRPKQTRIDPVWLEHGDIGAQTAHWDTYEWDRQGDSLTVVLDRLVERLPEHQRQALRGTVMAGMSYAEVGRLMGRDRKTVWRWARQGAEQVGVWLADTPWLRVLVADQLPGQATTAPSDDRPHTNNGAAL